MIHNEGIETPMQEAMESKDTQELEQTKGSENYEYISEFYESLNPNEKAYLKELCNTSEESPKAEAMEKELEEGEDY